MSTPGRGIKRVGYFALIVIFLVVIISLIRSLLGYLKIDDRFLVAEKEVNKLVEEKDDLEDKLYDEDGEYVVEKELRDSLGLSKPGETVVVLPEELVTKTIEERKQEVVVNEDLPNWKKWASLFY